MGRAVKVTVVGAGSWGTTVAALAAHNGPTTLWARDPDLAREINEQHTNGRYLDDRTLPDNLSSTGDMREALEEADVVAFAVPSHGLREIVAQAAEFVRPWVPALSLVKGLEPDTRKRPTEILADELPGHPVGLLAGPNLAREILDGFAAAAVVATSDEDVAKALQPLFHSSRFRVYRNRDILGSEMGGVLKNIIAIATGMADGLGVGDNTRAMVITRGLSEMTRLGEAMGADPMTFSGLTGLGDLMATCMSQQSRNRRVGEELGKGKTIEQVIESMNQVAEGVKTARSVMDIAREHDVLMPIAAEVDAVCNEGRTAADAYRGLM
ncbi:MAG: glycerol-3-phosphate dehydrogenase, partial [Solirubrobacteraceae bacterium]|nr:glycerol-3-phosphate dehydrogenase [Solirubrobacteraceae bacterium]